MVNWVFLFVSGCWFVVVNVKVSWLFLFLCGLLVCYCLCNGELVIFIFLDDYVYI